MHKTLIAIIFVLLTVVSYTNIFAYYFFRPKPSQTHPYLLISQDETHYIRQKDSRIPSVASAMTSISGSLAGGFDNWEKRLVENSFFGLVTDNADFREAGIALFEKYTKGNNRYSFDRFAENERKYLYSDSCTSLVLAYDLLYPYLNNVQTADGLRLLTEWGRGLYNHYSPQWWVSGNNFDVGAVGCLGLIGLALENELPEARMWADEVALAVKRYFYNDRFNAGGDCTDGLGYQRYGYAAPIFFSAAYERNRGVDLVSNANIMNVWNFYTYALQPHGSYVRFGDNSGSTIITGEDLFLLQKLQQKNDARVGNWLWTWNQIRGDTALQNGITVWDNFDLLAIALYYPEGIVPVKPALNDYFSSLKTFPSSPRQQGEIVNPGGMVSLRTGWGTDAVSVWLDNRWSWQGHQHYDPNSIRLSAYGQELVSYNNNRNYQDPLRGKLSQQNTVWLDNSDAPVSDFTTGFESILGRFTDMVNSESVDMISSDARYPSYHLGLLPAPGGFLGNFTEKDAVPMVQADRAVLLVKSMLSSPYVIINDIYNKDDLVHDYTWQIYVPNTASNLTGNGSIESPFLYAVNGVGLKMVFINQQPYSYQELPLQSGRDDHPIQINWKNVTALKNIALLFPIKNGVGDSIRVRVINQYPTIISITSGVDENQIVVNPDGGLVRYQDILTDARLLLLDREKDNRSKYLMYQGASLTYSGRVVYSATVRSSNSGTYKDCPRGSLGNLTCDSEGFIDINDLLQMTNPGVWRVSPLPVLPETQHTPDISPAGGDGIVDERDLARLLVNWSRVQ